MLAEFLPVIWVKFYVQTLDLNRILLIGFARWFNDFESLVAIEKVRLPEPPEDDILCGHGAQNFIVIVRALAYIVHNLIRICQTRNLEGSF